MKELKNLLTYIKKHKKIKIKDHGVVIYYQDGFLDAMSLLEKRIEGIIDGLSKNAQEQAE